MQPASAQRVTMERTRLRREAVCEKCSQEVARLDEEIEARHVRREAAMLVWEAAKSKLQTIDDSIAAIPSDEEDAYATEPVSNVARATELVASLSSGNASPELLAVMAQAYVAAFPQGAGSGREEEDVDMREPIAVATTPKRRAAQLTSQHRVEQMCLRAIAHLTDARKNVSCRTACIDGSIPPLPADVVDKLDVVASSARAAARKAGHTQPLA
jgi:hypothetical protein